MAEKAEGVPTTVGVQKQFEMNVALLNKSVKEAVRIETALLNKRIAELESNQRKAEMPDTFLGPLKSFVKSFDDHLIENRMTLEQHMEKVRESLANASFGNMTQPALGPMQKSIASWSGLGNLKEQNQDERYHELMKSWNSDPNKYADLAKSILGDPADPGAPGSWYNFLEENLSRMIQRIMLSNEDATALQSIPTSITSNIVPEVARLKTYGVGYGKHTMGYWIAPCEGNFTMITPLIAGNSDYREAKDNQQPSPEEGRFNDYRESEYSQVAGNGEHPTGMVI